MTGIHCVLDKSRMKSQTIMQVHDEPAFEVTDAEKAEAETLMRREMERVMELSAPVAVDIGRGKNWAGAH